MDALLPTRDRSLISIEPFRGEHLSNTTTITGTEVALQVSRNLYEYFGADSEIVASSEGLKRHESNVIMIAIGRKLAQSLLPSYPITISAREGVCIRIVKSEVHSHAFHDGLGVILLRPLRKERLEAAIWGFCESGLRAKSCSASAAYADSKQRYHRILMSFHHGGKSCLGATVDMPLGL